MSGLSPKHRNAAGPFRCLFSSSEPIPPNPFKHNTGEPAPSPNATPLDHPT